MHHRLNAAEKSICASLTLLYAIRMLGLFIVLPIFSLYAHQLDGGTPLLVGLVFSSYALTQMLLQPVFGWASDCYGRKNIIVLGLILFIVGSLIIASSNNIIIVLGGRIVQGSGAISAAVLALATDLTRDEIRTKVMAIIGVSIGCTFGLAMFLGPFLHGLIGVSGVFIFCAILGVIGILITLFVLPNQPDFKAAKINISSKNPSQHNSQNNFKRAFNHPDLWRLYVGALSLHLLLTMTFMVIPFELISADIAQDQHWQVYVPCFVLSILVMGAAVGIGEKRGQLKPLFLSALSLLIAAFVLLALRGSIVLICIALTLFFIGFNIMEATQPSLMARFTPVDIRGMAMGIFSSAQFLGASIGGILASLVLSYKGVYAVFALESILALIWLAIAWGMNNPVKKSKQENSQNSGANT